MPDVCLDRRRPFALVTTVRRSGPRARAVHPQLDLDLPGYSLRLRFADAHSLAMFSEALANLVADTLSCSTSGNADVHVRVIQPCALQLVLPY